ncbi:S8 family serine peptidase [Microlunatus sp. Gsoil 973]|uniref:S8 family serine peptidase n=1 Tax=Microlunatus sp. Gsoil 973 TaxID=2672569 RepID=UPI0012B4D9CA|nr:S8 family serine peptidase [Microlunatus sp. Gsoil 973]QGN33738.1 S8 family serine peptidase [Microlunatus sp. Gsoil 973]
MSRRYAMAPGARHLLVGGDGCTARDFGAQALFDADLAVINGTGNAPLATIASNSWGLTDESVPGDFVDVMHQILVRAAAEGVGMYFASGDDPGVFVPASDPFAISVGGTSLGIGARNQRLFETGWSNQYLEVGAKGYINDGINRSAAGGGTSLIWKQPRYQRGVVPASVALPGVGDTTEPRRVVPDISAVADAFTGIQQVDVESIKKGDSYWVFADGGTSLSSPLVAGMVATVQQRGGQLGFANPALYALAGTNAVHDALPVTRSTPAKRAAVFCPESNDLCGIDSLQTLDSRIAPTPRRAPPRATTP